ncbi:NDP-hexose 2,3-dehydratase [Shimia thalassica]|uniref:NDP-hexose 2,3-dehydratase n=1 Tax=Shimia thalassica TaxID=1715693 RepID=A0A0P1IR21_9RHOB|nr:NDP-hexose 2,3-dehydratase family protein [Shimia thalassica]CUK14158.1 NDP-hexose 2,3-dehydratase [Shimia thalassica]
MDTMMDISEVNSWVDATRLSSQLRLRQVPFEECRQWYFSEGRFCHETGAFFSITGVHFPQAATGTAPTPSIMIDQPEVGWLAFFIRSSKTDIQWLVQAKTEPGNIQDTHLAPTIQATRSNYQRVHGGRPTLFLETLKNAPGFVSDAPHSEQGTRFVWKFNRNSVAAFPDTFDPDLSQHPQWQWVSSATLREALGQDYFTNTDARSVVSTAPWALLASNAPLFKAPALAKSYATKHNRKLQILDQLLHPKPRKTKLFWERATLDAYRDRDGFTLKDATGKDVVACYETNVNHREVPNWCQPFLLAPQQTDHALLMRVQESSAEVFVRVLDEPGFGTRREFGPSVHSSFDLPDLMQNWLSEGNCSDLVYIQQSDEGGRFMQANASYRVALVKNTPDRVQYPFGRWVSLATLEQLVAQPGKTTNELRTLVSLVLSAAFDRACQTL